MATAADLLVRFRQEGADDVNRAAGGITGTIGKMVSGLGGIGLAAQGISAITGAISGVAQSMISGNAEMERYETQLGTLLGSSDAAKERLAELAKFGAETPFELPELVRAEKVLIGFGLQGQKAMERTGMSAEALRTVVGDVAAGVGVPFEELAVTVGKFSTGATGEAIARFQELGIVTKEELAAMGIAFDKGGSMTSPVNEALTASVKIMKEKFGGGMADLSATFEGRMSTLMDTWGQLKRTLMAPIFEALSAGLAAFLPLFGQVASAAEHMVNGLRLVGSIGREALGGLLSPLADLRQTFSDAMADATERASMIEDPVVRANNMLISLSRTLKDTPFEPVLGLVRDLFDSWRPTLENIVALFDVFSARTAGMNLTPLEKLTTLIDLAARGFGGAEIEGFADKIKAAVGGIGDFIEGFNLEPDMSFLDRIENGFGNVGAAGQILASVMHTIREKINLAWSAIQIAADILKDLWDTISGFMPDASTMASIIAAVAAGFKAFSVITSVVGLIGGLVSAWAGLGAGISAAGGIVAFIIGVLGGPLTIAIGAIAAVVALFAYGWSENWGGIQDTTGSIIDAVMGLLEELAATFKDVWENKILPAVAAFIDWFKANVEPTLRVIFSQIQAGLEAFAGWWRDNSALIIQIVQAAWGAISGVFSAAFSIIKGLVTAGLALIRGDFTGVMNAIQTAVSEAVPKIVGAFFKIVELLAGVLVLVAQNIIPATKAIFITVLETIATVLAGGAALIVGAIKGLIDALIKGAKAALGIASPSKIFQDIGRAIIDGLKAGIDAAWQAFTKWFIGKLKSIIGYAMSVFDSHSPSKVFQEIGGWIMAGLALGIGGNEADAVEALASVFQGMQQVVESGMKLMRDVLAFQLPATWDELRAKFRDIIKWMQALASEVIDTKNWIRGWGGDEVELSEPITAVINNAASIADAMAKAGKAINDWKGVSQAQIDSMGGAAVAIINMMKQVINQVGAAVGFGDFADAIVDAGRALDAVSKVDLDGITRVTAEQLESARLNIVDIWVAVANMSTVFRALPVAAREGIVETFGQFASAVDAASKAIMAGMISTDDLKNATRLTASMLDMLRLNVVDIWVAVANVSTVFRSLPKATREGIVEGLSQFAAAAGSAIALINDILSIDIPEKAADLGQDWTRLADISVNILAAVQDASGVWRMAGNEANGPLVEGVKQFVDAAGAAIKLVADVMKIAAPDKLSDFNFDWLQFASVARSILDAVEEASAMWRRAGEKANGELAAGIKLFVDAAGSSIKLIADVMSFKGGAFDPAKTSVDFYRFAEFAKFALKTVEYISANWRKAGNEANGPLAESVKLFADAAGAAVKLIADVMSFKGGDFDPTKTSVDFYRFAEFAKFALLSVRDAAKSFIALDEETRKNIVDGVSAFADAVGAALGIVEAVMGLASTTATSLPDQSVIERIFTWAAEAIRTVQSALGGMDKEAAELAKAGAEAAGAIGDAIESVVGGVLAALGLGGTGLMASDPNAKGLGFFQKVRGRRADFLAQQLRDTVVRAVTAISDALSGIDVGAPDNPRVKALEQLADAFSAVADAMNELANAKVPSAKQIGALLGALGALGVGQAGATGGAGAGAGSNPITFQNAAVTWSGGTLMTPPINARVTVTTTPSIVIGDRTIERLTSMVEERLADSFILGTGGP